MDTLNSSMENPEMEPFGQHPLWMDEILHHFEAMKTIVGICREIESF